MVCPKCGEMMERRQGWWYCPACGHWEVKVADKSVRSMSVTYTKALLGDVPSIVPI